MSENTLMRVKRTLRWGNVNEPVTVSPKTNHLSSQGLKCFLSLSMSPALTPFHLSQLTQEMKSPSLSFIFIFHLISRCVCEHQDLFNFFTSGARQIYFDQLNNIHPNVTDGCKRVFVSLSESVFSGERWANAMVDASASTPVGVYKGTITSLGAFDSCLANEKATHYCLIESGPSNQVSLSSASLKLRHQLPAMNYFNITTGVCMPRECNENDVMLLWSKWLALYSLELDNRENITCSHQPEKRISSYFAFYALTAFVLFQLVVGVKNIYWSGSSLIERAFSPHLHLRELFRPSERQATAIDLLKVFMIVMGISAHCLLCLEKLHAMALLGHSNYIGIVFQQYWVQGINEQGFDFFSILGGYVLWCTLNSSSSGYTWLLLVLEKYLFFIPATLCLILFELAWPLAALGPFSAKMTRKVLDHCEQNWWEHPLLLTNSRVLTGCLGHTFFTSVHIHLLIIGSLMILVLKKNAKIGLTVMAASYIVIYICLHRALQGITTPVLIDWQTEVGKTVDYLSRVHFPTYPHIPPFFGGIFIGFIMQEYPHLLKKLNLKVYFSMTVIFLGMSFFSPSAHNIFHLLSFDMYPSFIVTTKVMYALYGPHVISVTLLITEAMSSRKKPEGKKHPPSAHSISWRSSVIRFITRIVFSMHMINYAFIKFDFSTSRSLYFLYTTKSLERISYSTFSILCLAIPFHVFCIAPFNKLRIAIVRQIQHKLETADGFEKSKIQ